MTIWSAHRYGHYYHYRGLSWAAATDTGDLDNMLGWAGRPRRPDAMLTVWWAGTFISACVRRAFDKLIFLTVISHYTFDNLTFTIRDFLDFVDCNFFCSFKGADDSELVGVGRCRLAVSGPFPKVTQSPQPPPICISGLQPGV